MPIRTSSCQSRNELKEGTPPPSIYPDLVTV